jgi:hypothetical protein
MRIKQIVVAFYMDRLEAKVCFWGRCIIATLDVHNRFSVLSLVDLLLESRRCQSACRVLRINTIIILLTRLGTRRFASCTLPSV